MESVIVECYQYEIPTLESVSKGQFSNHRVTRHTLNQSVTTLHNSPISVSLQKSVSIGLGSQKLPRRRQL